MAAPAMERDDSKPRADRKKAPSAKSAAKPATKPAAPRQWERPRGGTPRAIGDLMPQIGRSAFRRFGFIQSSVISRWPDIVGERHARACMPEAIRFPPGEKSGGILQLLVQPAHAPLIQHVIPEIIERVNRFFGYNAVAKVKLRQGEVRTPHAERRTEAPPSLKPTPLELGDSLRDIGDPELRAVLESLARSLASQNKGDETP